MLNMLWFSFPVHAENSRVIFKEKRVLTNEEIAEKQEMKELNAQKMLV